MLFVSPTSKTGIRTIGFVPVSGLQGSLGTGRLVFVPVLAGGAALFSDRLISGVTFIFTEGLLLA